MTSTSFSPDLHFVEAAAFEDVDTDRQRAQRRAQTYTLQAINAVAPLESKIVSHPRFSTCLSAIDRVFQLSRALSQPVGARIFGPPGTGKTTVCRYFMQSFSSESLLEQRLEAVHITARNCTHPTTFIQTLLKAIDYPLYTVKSRTLGIKRDLVLEQMERRRTRLVLIDEAELLMRLTQRGRGEGNYFTEFLREALDARIGVVLVGGESLAKLEETDKYLASRCGVAESMHDFRFGGPWLGLIKPLIAACPAVDSSILTIPAQQRNLHRAAAGNLRRLKILMTEAFLMALDAKSQALTEALMHTAFERAFGTHSAVASPWRLA